MVSVKVNAEQSQGTILCKNLLSLKDTSLYIKNTYAHNYAVHVPRISKSKWKIIPHLLSLTALQTASIAELGHPIMIIQPHQRRSETSKAKRCL